jgi:hypothetical protein
MRYRLKVFLILTGALVALFVIGQLVRDRGHADERATYAAVRESVLAGQARIDSLDALLDALDARNEAEGEAVRGARERIGLFERGAEWGSLPAAQHREYDRAIAAHNRSVTRYNAALAEMQRVYAEYSALVDAHNALVDSANAMQRRATQEGYALPE